jgi:tRNA (cytidine/uridine-2'-O-)-methyltransferase
MKFLVFKRIDAGCWMLDAASRAVLGPACHGWMLDNRNAEHLASRFKHPASSPTMPAEYEPLLHVVLHQPEIPYNTGSVGRTCVAVGAKLWLVRPLGFRVDNYYLRRAGLDYWEHLNWQVVENWDELVAQLSQSRLWLFTKKAQRSYLDVAYARGDVLVFGSESAGLPDSLLAEHPHAQLRIPTRSDVRSLNLSNAVAVASYEALRQWQAATQD